MIYARIYWALMIGISKINTCIVITPGTTGIVVNNLPFPFRPTMFTVLFIRNILPRILQQVQH